MDAEPQKDDVRAELRATMESMKEPQPERPSEAPPSAQEAPPEPNPRPRDEVGRFATKPKEAPAKSPTQAAPPKPAVPEPAGTTGTESPTPPPEVPRAPPTLKPALKKAWDKLDPEARAALLEREGEVSNILTRTAGQRKSGEAFEKMLAPYRQHIQGDPVQVAGTLFALAHRLDKGGEDDKAQVLAGLIRNSRVPLEKLNAFLGEAPPQQAAPQQPQEFRDSRFDAFLQQAQQRMERHHAQQVQEFGKKAPHLDEPMVTPDGQPLTDADGQPVLIRDVAADFIASHGQRGIALSLEQAYGMAVALHPELSRQQQQAESAKAPPVVTPQARRAAGMPKTEPAVPVVLQGGGSVQDDVRAALNKLRRK